MKKLEYIIEQITGKVLTEGFFTIYPYHHNDMRKIASESKTDLEVVRKWKNLGLHLLMWLYKKILIKKYPAYLNKAEYNIFYILPNSKSIIIVMNIHMPLRKKVEGCTFCDLVYVISINSGKPELDTDVGELSDIGAKVVVSLSSSRYNEEPDIMLQYSVAPLATQIHSFITKCVKDPTLIAEYEERGIASMKPEEIQSKNVLLKSIKPISKL